MPDKQVISSWGKISNKKIDIRSALLDDNVILPIGNLNSYGDSCIPKNDIAFKSDRKALQIRQF